MSGSPAEISLELRPRARVDVIDVTSRIVSEFGDLLADYRKALYCSHHTTAGYFEQSLCARLEHNRERLDGFLKVFQGIFPPNANYHHDRLHLRTELSDEQRRTEPRNADSHLTFIGSGLENCVTYVNRPDTPVFFIDLDGVNDSVARTRRTTVLAFDREQQVADVLLDVPVSTHPIDSINLRDQRVGVVAQLSELIVRHGITKGRIEIALDDDEQHAGLTVNEYETLLMKNDLAEVLKDPVRYAARVARRGKGLLRDPRSIPGRTLDYAQYDLVQVMNELMDALGVSESFVERLVARFFASASHFLRLKRSLSLLISDHADGGRGAIVHGTYQSPILMQWRKAPRGARSLRARLSRFQ